MLREQERSYEALSPFEIKNKLIELAEAKLSEPADRNSARAMLNAGRGNPNWIATTPREAFFTLGQFGIAEAKRVYDAPHLGGMPQKEGIGERFESWATAHANASGLDFLKAAITYGVETLGFDRDAFLYELTDSVIGDNYPVPDRMLSHAEQVVHAYLVQEMCAKQPPAGKYDLFAVEGGTAAMCYIFNSLLENKLMQKGDTVALGAPIFTPYIEIPHNEDYQFKTVDLIPDEEDEWQYPASELDKLRDPAVKAFFLVNPGNPSSYAIRPESLERFAQFVKTERPDLIVITDDVYGTFVQGFRSLMAVLPQNTIGVYSYSKYFGCTGWRLGVVAIHEDNIFDQKLAQLSESDRQALAQRYSRIALDPQNLKFIDRMVADSRQVALNHTAGLSLPQQVQMILFSMLSLMDTEDRYRQQTMAILDKRIRALYSGMGIELKPSDLAAYYYRTLDFELWMQKHYGDDLVNFVKATYEPVDIVFRLAEQFSTVLLNGSGFDATAWSARASLANLNDDAYEQIGKNLHAIAAQYVEEWETAKKKG